MPLYISTPTNEITSTITPRGRKRAKYEMCTRYAGMPGYVDSAPIRAHIDHLTAHRVPMASIARDAGVGYNCVFNIHAGVWDTTRIRHAVAIMSVDWHPNARQETVSAIGAARRLRALYALGWDWTVLAEHCEFTRSRLAKIADPTRLRVNLSWDTWAAIRDLYEQLSGTIPPPGKSSTQARNTARKRKWAPPLDWDDADIDDPTITVKPSGAATTIGLRDRANQRRHEVARLSTAGLSIAEIAVRLGVSRRLVERYRKEPNTHVSVLIDDDESAA